MRRREDLQHELEEFLGSKNVYFQPPPSVKMNYPCIRYRVGDGHHDYADDKTYMFRIQYEITIITFDPDNELVEKMAYNFPRIRFSRHYYADNLNHYVFTLYY